MPLDQAIESPQNALSSPGSGDFMSFDQGQDERASVDTGTEEGKQAESALSVQDQETPAGQQEDVSAEQDAGDPAAAQPASFKGIKPEVVALIKHLAKNSELDLNNPRDFKLARQLAEKESRIRELSKAQEPSPEAKSYLDAFRDQEPEAAAPTTEKPASTEKAPAAIGTADLPPFVQKAMAWKDPKDFAKSLLDAYQGDESPEMLENVANTYLGFLDRTMQESYIPTVMAQVEKLLENRLGPVVQEVQQSRTQSQYRGVVETLAKQEGMTDIMGIFEPASDGTVMVNGEEAPDTWLNRALAEFPEILEMKEKGRNDNETWRLTAAKQYRAAHRMVKVMRRQNLDPKSAGHLVKAGVAIAESKRDPVRHGLNAGKPGVSAAGDRRVDDIFAPQGGKSLDSIFG